MQIEAIIIPVEPVKLKELHSSGEIPLRPTADLSDATERAELSPAAIREFLRIAVRWELTEERSLGLLGGISSSSLKEWRSMPEGKKLDQDTLTRISLVIGIYRALHGYFGDPWADRWIRSDNMGPLFLGRSPIDYVIREGLPGLIEVRRLIEGWGVGH